MYLDIMVTIGILIIVYTSTWGSLATWPLFIFERVLGLFSLSVCAEKKFKFDDELVPDYLREEI